MTGVADTRRLGRALATLMRKGDFVGLKGPLGAGKTTLARALVAALDLGDPGEEVVSPTYTLAQTYETASLSVTHFDLYRLERERDMEELGIDDALETGMALVEWPERLGRHLPRDRLIVELFIAGEGREAEITAEGEWASRLDALRGARIGGT